MFFPQRIIEIANLIEPDSNIADVGADHGKLELFLVANKEFKSIVAIENKIGPYKILKESLIGLEKVRTSLSSGLTAVDRKVDTVILAGMGGKNIINILKEYPDKTKALKYLIIDAHRDIAFARKEIVKFGFEIVEEKIVFEANKYYIVSKFKRSLSPVQYSDDVYEIGLNLEKSKLWPDYRDYLINTNLNTLAKIKNANGTEKQIKDLNSFNKRLKNYGKN